MAITERRVRRPRDKEFLLQQLKSEAGFTTNRDVLLFAAALGFQRGRREPFAESEEPIRWDTLTEPAYAKTLVSMIAAATVPEDPEILSVGREEERIRVFEEFANGGLEVLQGEINKSSEPVNQVCFSLVIGALTDSKSQPALSTADHADDLPWD